MNFEKEFLANSQRDISYVNEIRMKTKRSLMENFSNKQINQSTLMNENDLSFLNKVHYYLIFV